MSDRKTTFIPVVRTATMRGQLDLIAIERAVNGRAPEGMTGLELHEAARILVAHGGSATTISAQLRVPAERIRRWFPELVVAPLGDYVCGTPRAYRHHLRLGETCRECCVANTANDRAVKRGLPSAATSRRAA
ncbi:hypothetical protein ACFVV7_37200 [Streptomyces globisporus]|uniref:hypothetical protein n=1 Tax=Streptomycetaceae TaxID=2062 RepID=UPI0036DDED9B